MVRITNRKSQKHSPPPDGNGQLSQRLSDYRLKHFLTYERLAGLIGISDATTYRACLGVEVTARIRAKIKSFLESVGA